MKLHSPCLFSPALPLNNARASCRLKFFVLIRTALLKIDSTPREGRSQLNGAWGQRFQSDPNGRPIPTHSAP